MFFETERLFARKINLDDIIPFHEMQSNANVMKYIIGRPKTKGENIDELNKIISSYEILNNDFLVMAVVRKTDNKFVGTCAVVKNENGEHEIGYRLLERYWGNGFGKEILENLIKYCLQTLYLDSVVAYVDKDNYASVKIMDGSIMNFVKEYPDKDSGELIRCYKLSKSDFGKNIM